MRFGPKRKEKLKDRKKKPFETSTFCWTEWETDASGAIVGKFVVTVPPIRPLDKADDATARNEHDRKYYDEADEVRNQVYKYLKSDDAKRTMGASVEQVFAHVDKKVVKVRGLELENSKVFLAWASEEHWETEISGEQEYKLLSAIGSGRHLVRSIKPHDTVEVWLLEKNKYNSWQFRAPRWLCCLCDSWAPEPMCIHEGRDLCVAAKMKMKKVVDRAVKAAADKDVTVYRELDTVLELARQADALKNVPQIEVGEIKMQPMRVLGNVPVRLKPNLLLGGLEFIHPLVPLTVKSSLLDMPVRDQWRFFYSGSKTNPIPPQLRKFAHRFLVGFVLFSVLCFGQIYGGKDAVSNRLLLMMLFFFGVAALRAFFLEQYSDWFARRVVRRMRFSASIPPPKFESSFGLHVRVRHAGALVHFFTRCSDVRRVFLGRVTPYCAGGRHGWVVYSVVPTAHRR